MSKKFFYTALAAILASSITSSFGQVEVIGTGNTSATNTFMTKNSNGDTTALFRDDGNVGIGLTNPQTKLDVNGIITAGSGVKFSDGTLQTTAATGVSYANVVTVAQSGGDFTTIGAAIASITGASANNPYLVRVMPGIYTEAVICQKFISLSGAGKYACTINGPVVAADSIVIEGFTILFQVTCNGTSPTIWHNIISNGAVDNGIGIHVTNAGRPWIKENEILDCTGWGIWCQGFGSDAWIIANKILRNGDGGIRCDDSSPLISNNLIDHNLNYGIFLTGNPGTPSEPTIDDNVIGHTDSVEIVGLPSGTGIYMINRAEPRIIANDIYLNVCGIWVDPASQPSIIGNNLNYNNESGIRCYSSGATKRVVITGNHIHSNANPAALNPAGIWVSECNPLISHNVIIQNDPGGVAPDLDYSSCVSLFPVLVSNVLDLVNDPGGFPAPDIYNSTSLGAIINP